MYQVSQIPAFNDNYIWLLTGDSQNAAVVDPGDADVVLEALKVAQLTLTDILITHHHPDHIGGVKELLAQYPETKVYTPNTDRFQHIGEGVEEGDKVFVKAIEASLEVVELHGHTSDHIGYLGHNNAFVGDTLFSGGCGRLFEGTAEQMHLSLNKLANLPSETQVYCAHEYTLANLAFAASVDKDNPDLKSYHAECQTKRNNGISTVPTTIGTERKINPFLRCNQESIQLEIQRQCGLETRPNEVETFANIRALKDNF